MGEAPRSAAPDPIMAGRARLAEADWVAARQSFSEALARDETPEALEGLGWAAWWLDDDLTPENFEAGRREAAAEGAELEWRVADAEALPFTDDEFDVVTSSFGALFAPHHQAVADELLRVCRPGGVIGMLNFTPEGLISDFFAALAPYMPPSPPDALPPPLWGSEEHVRELFGDRVESLQMTRGEYVEEAESPGAYVDLFRRTFGPVAAIYVSLADDLERLAALDRDILEFATRTNRGSADGHAKYHYEYLLVVARKHGSRS